MIAELQDCEISQWYNGTISQYYNATMAQSHNENGVFDCMPYGRRAVAYHWIEEQPSLEPVAIRFLCGGLE